MRRVRPVKFGPQAPDTLVDTVSLTQITLRDNRKGPLGDPLLRKKIYIYVKEKFRRNLPKLPKDVRDLFSEILILMPRAPAKGALRYPGFLPALTDK